jgi:isoleucyl-tRNA synthetase
VTSIDPHRPAIDDVTFACRQCGELATRVEPVIDAWFDSAQCRPLRSATPTCRVRPRPSRSPAQFIAEAIDQTRGWFYSLLAVNTLVFGATPYEHVLCLGHIVDADGKKMSKSVGNVI